MDVQEAACKELDKLHAVESQTVFTMRELWEASLRFAESGMSFNPSAAVLEVAPQRSGAQPDGEIQVELPGGRAAIAAAVPSCESPGPGEVAKWLEGKGG
eukprot:gb/GEZJ01000188.1/.p4 GENE.gb/GEZJ01000188.1/~~gb/GEZJ01000188.1/.p4  ORF type:complete len:100 (+),score=10.73 gb/GEZJ01000188.1/:1454-1753(+)